jgi:hypothetical protein
MTPETTDGLSDAELIERVGREVMGWRGLPDCWVYQPALPKKIRWNPLTDWNATMEVHDTLLDRGYSVNLFWNNMDICTLEWTLISKKPAPYPRKVVQSGDGDMKRAICLAALKCVQASGDKV